MYFSLGGYYLRLKKCMALNLNKFECVMFGRNWPSGSGEDFQSCRYIINSCYCFLWQKAQCPSFEWNWIPLTQGCSVPNLVWIDPVVLENKSSMYFHDVAITCISLWQRAFPFIGTNLNRLHLDMMYVNHGGT